MGFILGSAGFGLLFLGSVLLTFDILFEELSGQNRYWSHTLLWCLQYLCMPVLGPIELFAVKLISISFP